MLKIKLIVVDRTRAPFLREGESFYVKRILRYAPLEWIEVKPAKISKGKSDGEILSEEAANIAKRLGSRDYAVALDRSGRSLTSSELAAWIEGVQNKGVAGVTFIIGGPLGLSSDILSKAEEILSLSSLTFTHEMSRLVLLEQVYRAFTILHGEKYHK